MNSGEIYLTHWLQASSIVVSDPDVPTLHGTASVQQTSVSLDWNFGATAVVNSSVVYYVDVSSTTSTRQPTEMTERLTGLTPGHTYVYYLCVWSFDKTACSTNYTVTTREYITHSLSAPNPCFAVRPVMRLRNIIICFKSPRRALCWSYLVHTLDRFLNVVCL